MTLLTPFFERTVAAWPEALALDIPPGSGHPARQQRTYAALHAEALALAHRLRPTLGPEAIVALLLPRHTVALYQAQLATLLAGAAYVALDPSFPAEQLRTIWADADPVVLLTDPAGQERALAAGLPPEHCWDIVSEPPPATDTPLPPAPWLTPESLAYLIYTSGTTGQPKGVMIAHQSIANLVTSDLTAFGLGPGDRIAQGSSPAYDSSVEEIWLALASGGTIVPLDDDTVRLGPDLIDWLRDEHITVACPPPTLLRATGCENPQAALPALKLLYVGGEALPRDIADRWAAGRRLVNGYGPTECTVTALRTDIVPGGPITIGWPVPGLTAWVLDEAGNVAPDGTQGELCLGGIGLARGYRNRPELTAEKFPNHPTLGRIYHTGDLVERTADGAFLYFGRIDSQVKLRGYRIELEAIETCLAACPGVREAACHVQGEGAQQALAAFIVPSDPAAPPAFDTLRAALAKTLPPYMVPPLYGVLETLPKSVGGKLQRSKLPTLTPTTTRSGPANPPRTDDEARIAAAFVAVLGGDQTPSIDDDFFHELGGSSLLAAQVISRLRTDPRTASLTVRDLYDTRTIAGLASRITTASTTAVTARPRPPRGRPAVAMLVQGLWLLLELLVGTAASYATFFGAGSWLLQRVPPLLLLLLAPLGVMLGVALYTPLVIGLVAAIKRLLIGRYTPQRAPVWGSLYLRNWIVQRLVHLIPWALLEGTEFQNQALRALGARIGQRVHLHRGVNLLQGGWDLLTIGDDVTVGQDVALRLVELDDGELVLGAVTIGDGATLEVRSGLGPDAVMEPGSYLTALSSLPTDGHIPAGERWDGIPAQPAGRAPEPPPLPPDTRTVSPVTHGLVMALAQLALWAMMALPFELATAAVIAGQRLSGAQLNDLLLGTGPLYPTGLVLVALAALPLPATLALEALTCRALGKVEAGVLSRWSPAYLQVWIKAGLVESAGIWLSGSLFWPHWLRAAGMQVGRDGEISTIIDVIPELVSIGPETFFADGIYLGGPLVHRGTVTVAPVTLSRNTFVGNHAVLPGGQHLPEDILLGVCTVADDTQIQPGTSWFGHPPFELPRREVVECDRRLTHEPTPLLYISRLFWEGLRLTLPALPTLIGFGWMRSVATLSAAQMPLALPLLSAASVALPCLLLIVLKWALLGRVKPGFHPLWSCWCSRWDFLYVAWGVLARGALTALEGTPFLLTYLRAVGMRLGKDVVLGPGFSQVVDPDMLLIGDGATVNAMFQAHTFEDRVLKIDYVHVGAYSTLGGATVPLYGAELGEGTMVAPHSVILKHEHLLPHHTYEGAPTRAVTP